MGVTENKALASRVLDEIFHQGNLSLLDEIFAPDSRPGVPVSGGVQAGYRQAACGLPGPALHGRGSGRRRG